MHSQLLSILDSKNVDWEIHHPIFAVAAAYESK